MASNGRTTVPNGTSKLPEILTAPSLAEWFAAWIETQVERVEHEAQDAGNARLRRAEFAMVRNAASQIVAYHGPEAPAVSS